jgi:tetratricopeptide (TPR) repeat protein
MASTEETLALGVKSYEQGAWEDAERHFQEVLQAEPRHAEAHYYLGRTLHQQGRLKDAVASFQQAVLCRPDFPEAYQALGATFRETVQELPAAVSAPVASPVVPQTSSAAPSPSISQPPPPSVATEESLAAAELDRQAFPLFCEGKLDEALALLNEALRLNPYFAEAHLNLAAVLKAQGKLAESLASCERTVELDPDFGQAHLVLGQTLLTLGDYERGWKEYEWRWRCPTFGMPLLTFSQPRWDGSPIAGRSIFLRPEQGMGDTIHFVRYAAVLKEQGAQVIVECQPPLLPILKSCPGIDHLMPQNRIPPPFDVYALLLSLPAMLGTTLETVPANVPYLFADPELIARWGDELKSIEGFKIGICWQGSTAHLLDRMRSVPLAEFAPLAKVPGVHFISLQKGEGTEQIVEVAAQFPVIDFGPRLDEEAGAFMDTAAVMKNLDLVITVDTALCHLAGALGVPVWLALSFNPDWRWMQGRDDSPWYPTMRLFRQSKPGNYSEVFEKMAEKLKTTERVMK